MASNPLKRSSQDIPLLDISHSGPYHVPTSRQTRGGSTSLSTGPYTPSYRPATFKQDINQYAELSTDELYEHEHDSQMPALKVQSDHTGPGWMPLALSAPAILGLLIFNVLLLILVIILHWISATHNGLGEDTGSTSVYFGWRFLPTLFAVDYVFTCMVLLDQVSRTEAFAGSTLR